MPYPCIHVVTFALISILVPDYIQKRRGQVIKRRIFALNYRFSNKNDLVCAWREFHSTSCVLSTYYKGPARAEKSFIFNFEQISKAWISWVLGVKHLLIVGCEIPVYYGDNICDDENNNEACFFDGGDCCGSNVNTQVCTVCQCLDGGGKR